MPEELRLSVPWGTAAARAWGPADGKRVLAVHGWLDNAASFDHLAPRLPGLRLVALDLPGHGHSSHAPPGVLYPFVDYVAAVHQVVAALGWDRLSLIGHSLGAGVTSIFAGTFPTLVERLVLIEGLGPLSEDPKHAPERLAKSVLEQADKHARDRAVYASREIVERRLLATASKMKPASVATLLDRGLVEVDGGVSWRSDAVLRMASRLRLSEAQVLAFLQAIACPTLLLRGESGYSFVPDVTSTRVAAVSDVEVQTLPGGHHLHLDAPEPAAAAIAAFLDTEVAGGS